MDSTFLYVQRLIEKARSSGPFIQQTQTIQFTEEKRAEWVQKSIELLGEMLSISTNRALTVKLWSEANVKCGPCYRGFHAWFAEHPIDEDWEAWLDQAEKEIRENGWV